MMTNLVYKAIAGVMATLAKDGIAKDRKNEQQGYKFRGIDDVYNALAPALAQHGLCVLPRILDRQVTERTNSKGNALFYVVVEAEFDFIAVEDGSKHTVRTYGEAMDSADKATNKAMSAAYKYAAMQAFCIPTEGDNDADAITHDVAPKAQQKPVKPALVQSGSVKTLEHTAADVDHAELLLSQAKTAESLKDLWGTDWIKAIAASGGADAERVTRAKDDRKAYLTARVLQAG